MGLLKKGLFKRKNKKPDAFESADILYHYPDAMEIKPKRGYVFFSNKFKVDDGYACIASFFFRSAPSRSFGAFWGINLIPKNLPQEVVTINFDQVSRETDTWISKRFSKSGRILKMSDSGDDIQSSIKLSVKEDDFVTIAREHSDGASYLNVHNRLLIKAPTKEILDHSLNILEIYYKEQFGDLVELESYTGEQLTEMRTLFEPNQLKLGNGSHYTSVEYAGAYSLVTRGIEDLNGEYVGYMTGEVNNPAVFFDVNGFKESVLVASNRWLSPFYKDKRKYHLPDLWGVKIAQSALLEGHRVVHILLNDFDVNSIGPRFENLSYRLDMNNGDVNMFEVFGDPKDELELFSAQIVKLQTMMSQLLDGHDTFASATKGLLAEVAEKFYIDNGMWYNDAKNHREKLRLVGIPHKDVPKLSMFVSYLKNEELGVTRSGLDNRIKIEAISMLRMVFESLLSVNGSLFDTITNSAIDGVKTGRRVIYDFSKLMIRGHNIAMAQLVNIIFYAVDNLHEGDVLLIHGADLIYDDVKDYIKTQLNKLIGRRGRVVYLYNDTEKAFSEKEFNNYDKSDYMVLGSLTDPELLNFEEALGSKVPFGLGRLITSNIDSLSYIRRGYDNIVFKTDLQLGLGGDDS